MPVPEPTNIASTVRHYIKKGRPKEQAVAIAYNVKRKALAKRRQSSGMNAEKKKPLLTSSGDNSINARQAAIAHRRALSNPGASRRSARATAVLQGKLGSIAQREPNSELIKRKLEAGTRTPGRSSLANREEMKRKVARDRFSKDNESLKKFRRRRKPRMRRRSSATKY